MRGTTSRQGEKNKTISQNERQKLQRKNVRWAILQGPAAIFSPVRRKNKSRQLEPKEDEEENQNRTKQTKDDKKKM